MKFSVNIKNNSIVFFALKYQSNSKYKCFKVFKKS